MREAFRGHPHFEDTARFCELYDQTAFDPTYDSAPLDFFEPMVRRVFAAPKRSSTLASPNPAEEPFDEVDCRAALLAAAAALSACRPARPSKRRAARRAEAAEIAPILTTPDAVDIHSYARPLEARVTHVALDLARRFRRQAGRRHRDARHRRASPTPRRSSSTTRAWRSPAITDGAGKPLHYKVGAADANLGAPLAIDARPDTQAHRHPLQDRRPTPARCNG